jgi:hypothetical protein
MVRVLATIVEAEVSDDDLTCNVQKGCLKSALDTFTILPSKILPEAILDFGPTRAFEVCEPESELDPFCADQCPSEAGTEACKDIVLQVPELAQSKKLRKKRHASLIDKARKGHQRQQQSQDESADSNDPCYIQLSDLAADWSPYAGVAFLRSLPEPVHVHEAVVSTAPKRNRKKSMIDKAALQQCGAGALQRAQVAAPQIQIQPQANPATPKAGAFCSLCTTGKKKSFCVLCGSR